MRCSASIPASSSNIGFIPIALRYRLILPEVKAVAIILRVCSVADTVVTAFNSSILASRDTLAVGSVVILICSRIDLISSRALTIASSIPEI